MSEYCVELIGGRLDGMQYHVSALHPSFSFPFYPSAHSYVTMTITDTDKPEKEQITTLTYTYLRRSDTGDVFFYKLKQEARQ